MPFYKTKFKIMKLNLSSQVDILIYLQLFLGGLMSYLRYLRLF